MVGLRDFLIGVHVFFLVVVDHVLVEEFLVGDLPVVGEVVVQDQALGVQHSLALLGPFED